MLRITNGRDLFYQWDIGQSLTLTLAEGESVSEIHIGTDGGEFYVVEPLYDDDDDTTGIVAVYDELLQSGKRVVAYEYVLSSDETEGHTIRKYVFNVAKRPKADNYEYTPTQSYSWEYWCERARLYAVAAESSKNSAAASVSSIPATMTAWWNAHRSEFKGDTGADGQDGADGTSASAVVEQTSTGAVIYCTDADGTTTATITNGQDGETPDLTDYVKNTDYASASKYGVVKVGWYGIDTTADGRPIAQVKTADVYSTQSSNLFISKGTLENVLNARFDFRLIADVTVEETGVLQINVPNLKKIHYEFYNPNTPSATTYTTSSVMWRDDTTTASDTLALNYQLIERNGSISVGSGIVIMGGDVPLNIGMSGNTQPLSNGWQQSFDGRMFGFMNNLQNIYTKNAYIFKFQLSYVPSGTRVIVWGC